MASSTLRHITDRKLEKLAEHRALFEQRKQSLLQASSNETQLSESVQVLLDGFRHHNIRRTDGVGLDSLALFLNQSRHDPSISASLLHEWKEGLERDLEIQSLKYQYASLFGNLVIEWIDNPNQEDPTGQPRKRKEPRDSSLSDFEEVGRAEMHEQRKQWESYAFTVENPGPSKVFAYLSRLFGTDGTAGTSNPTPLEKLRRSLVAVRSSAMKFTVDSLEQTIRGLLRADLFAGLKRQALVEFLDNESVLVEMANVLNMDLECLDTWEWKPSPIPLHMRRQLNGKYRVYMDEDLHQAILIHFVGMHWAVELKKAFTAFYETGGWIKEPTQIRKQDKKRYEHFIGKKLLKSSSVRSFREQKYRDEYFMMALPSSLEEDPIDYEEGHRISSVGKKEKTPVAIKQEILRTISTEMLVNIEVYGDFTIVQSDFKWFGPSLPHSSIYAVLEFLGAGPSWRDFFKKFLEPSLVFAQDGPAAQAQKRKRGVPISHVLSDTLAEAVLFCLDFAVNKATKGGNLYRLHDDMWFWGKESESIAAWGAITEFAAIMGLQLNEGKTGSCRLRSFDGKPSGPASGSAMGVEPVEKSVTGGLPSGLIRWGLVTLDAEQQRWVINRAQIEEHIRELRRQLGACRSILSWVRAWNSYVDRFFTSNFGQPAACLGRRHIDMLIEAFKHIQTQIFPGRNVTAFLRSEIRQRFGVDDVPDGFFYLPTELGGLELRNPLIPLFAVRDGALEEPQIVVNRAFDDEEEQYRAAKQEYDENGPMRKSLINANAFWSFQEYLKYPEETSGSLRQAYERLLKPLNEVDLQQTASEFQAAVRTDGDFSTWVQQRQSLQTPYWRWILQLYGQEVVRKFGSLSMGEASFLPIGLVSMLRSEKVRWQG